MCDIIEIANKADMIISGYAFTKENSIVKIINLNNPSKALVLNGFYAN